MKPERGDIRHKLLISGDELRELNRHTGSMAEAFGLDRKIEAYKGTRPITFYRWDLECLRDVIDCELSDPSEYPNKTAIDPMPAMKTELKPPASVHARPATHAGCEAASDTTNQAPSAPTTPPRKGIR